MSSMQDQIVSLSAAVRLLAGGDSSLAVAGRSHPVVPPAASTHGPWAGQRSVRRLSTARESTFQGPTTSAFSFDLAKSSLESRGIVERNEGGDEEGDLTQEPSPLASPSAPYHNLEPRQSTDPLWMLPKGEALRLCRVYEEEMGIMYPILELSELLEQVHLLYGPMDRALGSSVQFDGNLDGLDLGDVNILRLVFACALTAEASGRSEQAIALFDSVREVQDNCVWGTPDIKSIIFLTLVVRAHALKAINGRSDVLAVYILFPDG
jgi:hypothetical protein